MMPRGFNSCSCLVIMNHFHHHEMKRMWIWTWSWIRPWTCFHPKVKANAGSKNCTCFCEMLAKCMRMRIWDGDALPHLIIHEQNTREEWWTKCIVNTSENWCSKCQLKRKWLVACCNLPWILTKTNTRLHTAFFILPTWKVFSHGSKTLSKHS